jgi:tetratricopeptide (TPR) repeat protein
VAVAGVLRAVSLGLIAGAFLGARAGAQEASAPRAPGEAYYYYCLGRMAEMQMQAETAVSHYQRTIRLDPEAPYPHVALAELYLRMRQVEKALESAKRGAELGPDIASAHRTLGEIYFSLLRSGGSPDLASLAIQAYRETIRLEPGDVQTRSALGRLLLSNRETADAAVQLEEVVRREPTAYYDMTLLAQIRQNEGDSARAIQLLKQSLAIESSQPEARDKLAVLLQAEGRFEELADLYQGSVEGDPTDVEARIRYADALAKAGRLEEAATEFGRALEGDPANVIAMVGLAMVHRERKKFDEAEGLLEKALQKEPGHALARYTLAGIYEETRELDRAIGEWKKLIDLPAEGKEADQRRAEYWAHLGFAYGELQRDEESLQAFEKARELADSDERYDAFHVQALLALNRPQEAREAIDQALARHPESARLRILETRVLESNGRTKEALQKALALEAEDPAGEGRTENVVDLYQKQGAFAEAEAFLRGKIEKAPDDAGLRFLLGAVLERQKKFEEARSAFEKVLEIEPNSAATLNYLGYMLADNGVELDQSLHYVTRALEQDPHNGAYLDSLGWVYFKMGRLDLAEDNLLKALKNQRLTGVVYDHLGDLYFRKGDLDQALAYWRKALDENDEDLEKDAVERKIEHATSPR